jgi:hypothetical protein
MADVKKTAKREGKTAHDFQNAHHGEILIFLMCEINIGAESVKSKNPAQWQGALGISR